MDLISTIAACFVISCLWGVTNVLTKKSTETLNIVDGDYWYKNFLRLLKHLLSNWKYLLIFLSNNIGSALFYLLLVYSELSIVVPVTNSLTFLSTAYASTFFGESLPSKKTILGSIFVIVGITCCVYDKINILNNSR